MHGRTAPILIAALLAPAWVPATGRAQAIRVVPPGPAGPPRAAEPWDRGRRVVFRAGLSWGYAFTFRYHRGDGPDRCNVAGDATCVFATPWMLDTAVGVGLGPSIEIDARFRSAMPTDFDHTHPLQTLQLGLGLRTVTAPGQRWRLFASVAALADLTLARLSENDTPADLVIRLDEGLLFDVRDWLGFFVQVGEGFGLLRNLTVVVDGTLGAEIRTP